MIAGVENPKDVCALSVKSWGQRATLKFAQYTGSRAIAGRFTPGTFTNQITTQVRRAEPVVYVAQSDGVSCSFWSRAC